MGIQTFVQHKVKDNLSGKKSFMDILLSIGIFKSQLDLWSK